MNETSNSVYIAQGDLGGGFEAYTSSDCTSGRLGTPATLSGQTSVQSDNGGKACVDLDTLYPEVKINSLWWYTSN